MSVARVASWLRGASRPFARRGVTPSGPTRTTVEFDREPPREWVEAVTAMAPLHEHLGGLAIHYETGDRWQPVHRWFLWQLQPWSCIKDPAIAKELEGPHPRTNARLEYLPRTVNGKTTLRPHIRGGPCRLIDRRTWELHRHYAERGLRVYPRRFWVIQGETGGHPFMIDQEDEALRVAQGLSGEVPSAGDLPYAPFDRRVADAIDGYDLWRWANGLNPKTAAVQARIARWNAVETAANRLRWAAETAHYTQTSDMLGHLMRRDGMHYHRWQPVGTHAPDLDLDAAEAAFIHDTTWSAA